MRALELDGEALEREIESAKRHFSGRELPGRCLAVVGLGAVGVEVAVAVELLGAVAIDAVHAGFEVHIRRRLVEVVGAVLVGDVVGRVVAV